MAQINFILQGKGGVGKSVCSALLAQYKKSKSGEFPLCIDLDPINTSFKNFKAFKVEAPHILDEEKQNISQVAFDDVISKLLEAEESIVDVGTMTFTPLCGYLKSNDTFSLLAGGDGKDNLNLNPLSQEVASSRQEIAEDTGVAPNNVSRILNELASVGAVTILKDGRDVIYKINPQAIQNGMKFGVNIQKQYPLKLEEKPKKNTKLKVLKGQKT